MNAFVEYQVETTGARELTNAPRIGAEFKERIANPKDVIQYYKRKVVATKGEYGNITAVHVQSWRD